MVSLSLGDTQYIIERARMRGVLRNQLAYILATACHETAHTMRPVRETLATSDKQAIARLDAAYAKGQLKRVKTPYWRDGWFGRGYVQITHKANYDKLGVTKQTALQRDTATRVLLDGMLEGKFTGHRLDKYVALSKSDFVGARKVVNGTDRAKDIADLARQYDAALLADGYGVDDAPVVDKPESAVKSKRLWTWLTAAGGVNLLGFGGLHPSVQMAIVLIVTAAAAYAIYSMPQIRKAIKGLFE